MASLTKITETRRRIRNERILKKRNKKARKYSASDREQLRQLEVLC
jgi:hypothetical protein